MAGEYWIGDISRMTVEEKATLKMIAWMEAQWCGAFGKVLRAELGLQQAIERIGDRAERDILATRYWDGKRRCSKCGGLTDRWFRGRLCRGCYFEEH